MLEFRLFGKPQVRVGKQWTVLKPSKLSALLLYLAFRQTPIGREQLSALFWADKNQQDARNSLRQLLSRLRQSEFAKAIVTKGEYLQFVGRSDINTPKGILLEDFVLPESPEFMAWLESSRLILRPVKPKLPEYTLPLIGREQEIMALKQLCQTERLVTVLGLGGMGKTRLCVATANHFDPVLFLALENASPKDLPFLLLEANGMAVRHNLELSAQCVAAYHSFQGLLCLDNFETVQSQENSLLLATMLEKCTNLRVLVSSREAVGIHGESIFALEGLNNQDAQDFFITTVKSLLPKWQPKPEDAPALLEVVRQTSAVPLALELVAVWLQKLPLAAVVQDLAVLPQTQNRLSDVLLATWQRQSQKVQNALIKAAVFRGGCTLTALRQVAQVELSLLPHLLPIFLRKDPSGRYFMPELLRLWIEHQNPGAALSEHAAFYAKFLGEICPAFLSTGSHLAFEHFRTELENLRLAWQTLQDQTVPAFPETMREGMLLETMREGMLLETMREGMFLGLQMMGLAQEGFRRFQACPEPKFQLLAAAFLLQSGEFARAQTLVTQTLPHISAALDLGIAHTILGEAQTKLGEYPSARLHLEQAIQQTKQHLPYWHAIALDAKGTILADVDGDYDAGNNLMLEALRLRQSLGDQRGVARSQISLGVSYYLLGQHQEAKQFWLEALTMMQRLGDLIGQGRCLSNLGVVFDDLGEHLQARQHLEQALQLRSQVGDYSGTAQALLNLGLHELERQHNFEKAKTLFLESLEIRTRLGEQRAIIGSQIALADLRLYPNDLTQAEQHAQNALSRSEEIGAVPLVHLAQIYLARLRVAQNRIPEALELLAHPLHDPTTNAENRSKAQKVVEEMGLSLEAVFQ